MEETGEIILTGNPLGIKESWQLKAIKFFLYSWFGGWKGWEIFLTQKKIVEARAENAYDLERKKGNLQTQMMEFDFIDALEKADHVIEYQNMFGVLKKTAAKIHPNSINNGEEIDVDKIKKLKDLAKEFSSEDMQELIAEIIAGEYNKPGAYSLQTISIIKNLSKYELELFQKVSGLIVNGDFIFNSFFDLTPKTVLDLRVEEGFDYDEFLYLQDLGLFSKSEASRTIGSSVLEKEVSLFWDVYQHKIITKIKGAKTLSRMIGLSKTGKELYPLIVPEYNKKCFEWIKNEFQRQGFIIESI